MAELCSCIFSLLIVAIILGTISNALKGANSASKTRTPIDSYQATQHTPPAPRHPVQPIPFKPTTYATEVSLKDPPRKQIISSLEQVKKLERANLSFLDLQEANFSNCELIEIEAISSNFIGCSFAGAKLQSVDFSNAFLTYADFSGAVLHNVNFSFCDLTGANFQNAVILNSSFEKSDLSNAEFASSQIQGCVFIDANKSRTFDLQVL